MTGDLLRVEAMRKSYPTGRGKSPVPAVDDVWLDIDEGETVGLVGESGSGKSTLAKLIMGLEKPDSGAVLFRGQDISRLGSAQRNTLRRQAQIVFQDPVSALNRRKTVEQIIGAPLRVNKIGNHRQRAQRVTEIMGRVGLDAALKGRYPATLSGGQNQRVNIARALVLEPTLLLLDEAVSALDVSIRANVLNLLRDLRGEMGLSYLFITHDLSIVRYMSARIAVMHRGQIVESGSREQIFRHPHHPYTVQLMDAIPVPGAVSEPRLPSAVASDETAGTSTTASGCRFRSQCPVGRSEQTCSDTPPQLTQVADHHFVRCHFHERVADLTAAAGTTMLGADAGQAKEHHGSS